MITPLPPLPTAADQIKRGTANERNRKAVKDVVDKSRAKVDHAVSDATEGVKSTGRGFFGGVREAARSAGRTLRIIGDKTECESSEQFSRSGCC